MNQFTDTCLCCIAQRGAKNSDLQVFADFVSILSHSNIYRLESRNPIQIFDPILKHPFVGCCRIALLQEEILRDPLIYPGFRRKFQSGNV